MGALPLAGAEQSSGREAVRCACPSSPLSYLQSFPFDKIKIDQSFVRNIGQSQSAAIIVIGLGRGLDLPVVADGVESEDQLAFLKLEKCDQVQDYLVSGPCPISDYAEFVGREKEAGGLSADSLKSLGDTGQRASVG